MKAYLLAAAAALALTACDDPATLATATPEPTPGPVTPADSLNGTYNLRASDCANAASPETRLVIEGNKFTFGESACTVAQVHNDTAIANVTLACEGEGEKFNRVVKLQSKPGELRLTDDTRTLTYFKCPAPAQTAAVVVTATPASPAPADVAAAEAAAAEAAAAAGNAARTAAIVAITQ